ncbi:MAG: ABC transporter permease [Phycisphaerales bacterium]|nr:ABC transporter permease [Phycisphaerales bacterium]
MTPTSAVWFRFRRHRPAVLSLLLLAALVAVCFGLLPWSLSGMRVQDLAATRVPPSAVYLLGTDDVGRSLLWRTLYGGAISLALGLLSAAIAVFIGTLYGAVAGYVGGRLDELMMRLVDVLYALPTLLLVMLFTVSVGAWIEHTGWLDSEMTRFVVLILAIGGVSWLTMARVIRGQVLSLREQPYIEAARALGLPLPRIILRHILPNLVGPIVVFATLTVPQAILQESFLSFLGVGVQPPQATWGSLAADGVRLLNPVRFDWWLIVFPCGALSLTLLALNFLGDGLRDAFDVRAGRNR